MIRTSQQRLRRALIAEAAFGCHRAASSAARARVVLYSESAPSLPLLRACAEARDWVVVADCVEAAGEAHARSGWAGLRELFDAQLAEGVVTDVPGAVFDLEAGAGLPVHAFVVRVSTDVPKGPPRPCDRPGGVANADKERRHARP